MLRRSLRMLLRHTRHWSLVSEKNFHSHIKDPSFLVQITLHFHHTWILISPFWSRNSMVCNWKALCFSTRVPTLSRSGHFWNFSIYQSMPAYNFGFLLGVWIILWISNHSSLWKQVRLTGPLHPWRNCRDVVPPHSYISPASHPTYICDRAHRRWGQGAAPHRWP